MKKIVLLLILTLGVNQLQAQIMKPVKWKTSVVKINDTDYDLVATATIDEGWHLYSQVIPEGDGPIPTTFTFEASKSYQKRGNTKEGEGHTVNDPVFNMKIKFFENKAEFKQRIRIKEKTNKINGIVNFMVCNDSSCLPPTEVDLSFDIK